jgi:thiamine-phosphate pyrophosphorylase
MDIIAYTSPGFVNEEYKRIKSLFDAGLKSLHVYKPGFDTDAIYEWLDNMGTSYWNRLVLHLYNEWITASVGGYHLSKEFLINHALSDISTHLLHGQTISVSTHSPTDWIEWKDQVHQAIISPVFESISKPEHLPVHHLQDWKEVFIAYPGKAQKVALGGISPENVDCLIDAGFDAIAVSGWFWEGEADTINRFNLLKLTVERALDRR